MDAWQRNRGPHAVTALRAAAAAGVAALAAGAVWLATRPARIGCIRPFGELDLYVAGSSDRAAQVLAGCSIGEVSAPLWRASLLLVPTYVAVLAVLCAKVAPAGYRVARLRRLGRVATEGVILAGVLHLAATAFVGFGLRWEDGNLTVWSWMALGASTMAWPALVLVALAALYAAIGLIGRIPGPLPDRDRLPPPTPYVPPPTQGPTVGICLSGGGVRAGTYGLGALQVLDEHGVYGRARYLAAVSGGSYTAGAWTIARRVERGEPPWEQDPAPNRPWADGSPEVTHLRRRLNYLRDREGGLAGALATLAVGLAINVAALFTLLWLAARPLGWLSGSWPVIPARTTAGELSWELHRRLWVPVAIWATITVVLGLVWVLALRVRSLRWSFAGSDVRFLLGVLVAAAAVITLGLALVLVAVPWAVASVPPFLRDREALARVAQVLTGGGIVAALVGMLMRPARRFIPRLGGVAVVLFGIAVGGEIASGAAAAGPGGRTTWLVVAVLFAGFYAVADPDWWSIQPYYRGRLRYAFATRRRDGKVMEVETSEEPPLQAYRETHPELLVCTSMNVSGRDVPTRVGVPAYSLTFSPDRIRFHAADLSDGRSLDHDVDTAWYARVYKRWDTPQLGVMTAVGISGAAVSPAMGRFNRGSTRALLALANLRLGMWMPNPRYLRLGEDLPESPERPSYPRRRLSYLVKEMFGLHDPDDPYVYVSDGGHWENLGLVELLRRRCTEVFCFDASGSAIDSFATFAEAVTLAEQELGVRVELGYEPLRAPEAAARFVERDCGMGLIHYPDGTKGVLWYAKISLTADAPGRLRAYKEKVEIFPTHPTSDQFFDTEQFECYRLLGRHTTLHLLALRAAAAAWLGGSVVARPGTTGTEPGAGGRAAPYGLHATEEAVLRRLDDDTRARLLGGMTGSSGTLVLT